MNYEAVYRTAPATPGLLIFKAMQCQEFRKYFNKKQGSLMHLQNKHFNKLLCHVCGNSFKKTFTKKAPDIFCIQVQDLNVSNNFYKIQNLKK